MSEIKKVNLAIQGGGARGAFVWGLLDAFLANDHIEIEGISATSAGCMNAVILSQGIIEGGKQKARELLRSFWKEVSEKLINPAGLTILDYVLAPYKLLPINFMLFKVIVNHFSPYQLNPLNYNPLRSILNNMIDFNELKKKNKIKLFISATNIKNGKLRVFTNDELSVDVLLASACLPYLFQAVEIDNEYYWDGGFLANPAIFPLIYQCQSKDIIILHTSQLKRSMVPTDAFEIYHRMTEISFNSSLIREMRAIAFITKIIDDNWIKDEYKDKIQKTFMHFVMADKALETQVTAISRYNTDWNFLHKLFLLGQQTGEAWLQENIESLGKNSTIDVNDWI